MTHVYLQSTTLVTKTSLLLDENHENVPLYNNKRQNTQQAAGPLIRASPTLKQCTEFKHGYKQLCTFCENVARNSLHVFYPNLVSNS